MSVYLVRVSALEFEYKQMSRGYAYACAQAALFELSSDRSYRPARGGDTLHLTPDLSCRIESVDVYQDAYRAVVSGRHENALTLLELTLNEEISATSTHFRAFFSREI